MFARQREPIGIHWCFLPTVLSMGLGRVVKAIFINLTVKNHKHTIEASSCKQTMTIPVKKANFLRKLDIVDANVRLTMKNMF